MNIGLFADTYLPQLNGVVTSIRTLEKELIAAGHDVYIFTTRYPSEIKDAPNVYRINSLPVLFFPQYRLATPYSPKNMKFIKKLNLDIIHTHTEFSLGVFGKIVASHHKIPLVHTYHTMREDYVHYITKRKKNKITPRIAKIITRRFCNICDAIISPSKKTKDYLSSCEVKKPIEIIATGINVSKFLNKNYSQKDILELKTTHRIPIDVPIILSLGRVAKEKSIDVVINAMPKVLNHLPKAKLVIVGDGPERKNLEKLVQDLNIKESVFFLGEQKWETIGKFYQLGDVFVSASTTETQGLTFIEAMASKIPVIARYDKNLDSVIFDKKNGRFFFEETELAPVLLEILLDRDKSKALVSATRKTVHEYSSTIFAEKVLDFYRKTIKLKNNS